MLASHKPLVVPMEMRISKVQLKGIVVLVVDKDEGVTLVFKSDPLQSVVVNSTFDDVPNIQRMLQSRIETQVRNMFQSQLPQMIHNLSKLFLGKKTEEVMEDVPVIDANPDTNEDYLDFIKPHHHKV
jgi:distribution and morphology protein 34